MCISRTVPNLVVFNSHQGANFHKISGYRCDRLLVVPNWIDCEEFKPCEQNRKKLSEKLKIEYKKIIGIVARLDRVKNHMGFLEFAQQMCQFNEKYLFLMIGEGILRSIEIKRTIAERGLN